MPLNALKLLISVRFRWVPSRRVQAEDHLVVLGCRRDDLLIYDASVELDALEVALPIDTELILIAQHQDLETLSRPLKALSQVVFQVP